MRLLQFAAGFLLLGSLLSAQVSPEERQRFSQIQEKHRRGEPITAEEEAFARRMMAQQSAQRQQAYRQAHPPRSSTGLIPLTELGAGSYKEQQGGLYPDGKNTPPQKHLDEGLARARRVMPLDRNGKPAGDGKVVLLSIGMSNTTMEFQAFQKLLANVPNLNPHLVAVDGAQGGQTAAITARPESNFWRVVEQRLQAAGVTPEQVQVVWIKEANANPNEPFPAHVKALQSDLTATLHILHERFPNLQIAYLSSRIYGGYAETPLNPEPYAYETGFAVKWLIADQIKGAPELNNDPNRGPVRAPWLAWGPYLWADGEKARKDGLTYHRDDLAGDGTHPSATGREKVAKQLIEFLRNEPTAEPWFLKK